MGYFFVLAGCVLVTTWGRIAVFTRAGETLTRKVIITVSFAAQLIARCALID